MLEQTQKKNYLERLNSYYNNNNIYYKLYRYYN